MRLKIYTRDAMYEERNTDARLRNHFCRWKARSITYSEFVSVVLVVQYEKRIYSIIHVLCCVTYPAIQYFPTLFQKRHDFRGKKNVIKKSVFWFSVHFLFETFLTLRKIRWDMIINEHRSSRKEALFLSHFKQTWLFVTESRKIINIKFPKNPFRGSRVVPCGWRDRRTDMTKLVIAIRCFAKAPIKELFAKSPYINKF